MEKSVNAPDQQSSLMKKTKRLVIFLISIVLVNLTLAYIEPTGTTKDLRGNTVSPMEVKKSVIILLLVGITFFGFLFGTIVSAIPYKKLPYSKKYLPASLLCIFALQIIYLILEMKYWFSFL